MAIYFNKNLKKASFGVLPVLTQKKSKKDNCETIEFNTIQILSIFLQKKKCAKHGPSKYNNR